MKDSKFMVVDLINKIKRKWTKLRLQPIRVFCFHQVSDIFDPESMWECDWMSTTDFKTKIKALQTRYSFISLPEAQNKLKHDMFRFKKYVVLTADDGWASIMNVIPWLATQNIPITLFINPLYFDGIHKQEREAEKLLTRADIEEIFRKYSNITIASHGWSHIDTLEIGIEEFEDNMLKSEDALSPFLHKVPFYAFTYGHYKPEYIQILNHANLIPVLINGNKNYKYEGVIDRECLDII